MIKQFQLNSREKRVEELYPTLRKKSPRSVTSSLDKLSGENANKVVIEISWMSYFKILLIAAALFLFSRLTEVLLVVFFAFVITSAVYPTVKWGLSKKIPKWVSIPVVYILSVVVIVGALSLIFVPFLQDLQQLLEKVPALWQSMSDAVMNFNMPALGLYGKDVIQAINNAFVSSGQPSAIISNGLNGAVSVLQSLSSVANIIVFLISSIIISIYIILDHENFLDIFVLRVRDPKKQDLVRQLVAQVEEKLGRWIVGQVVLCFTIGFLIWVMLTILGVQFALPLSVLAGLLELVPNLGPIITVIPIAIITFLLKGPSYALLSILGEIIVQQLEYNIIVPRIMGTAVGLKPIYVILGILVGFALGGIIGSILAVPCLVIIRLCLDFYLDIKRIDAESE